MKQARTTRHPCLVACDANMEPEDVKKSLWFKNRYMFIEAPGEVSACGSKGSNGELTERTYDNVTTSQSQWGKIKKMEVVEDFESRPHKAVTFLEERDKELQEVRELKMPKALPGYSGGKLSGRSKAEGGGEKEEKEEE